jgi:hypothetical protein
MTPVERHAELVFAESLYEKVSVLSPPTYADINAATGRVCLVSCTQGIGLHSSRKCEYSFILKLTTC